MTINIKDFIGQSQKSIHEFVMLQAENKYKIKIPQVTGIKNNRDDVISWQYTAVAYFGHLLNDTSISFKYQVPAASKNNYFLFEVEIRDAKIFAALLYQVKEVFFANPETEMVRKFTRKAYRYLEAANDKKIEPVTSGLLTIANKYSK